MNCIICGGNIDEIGKENISDILWMPICKYCSIHNIPVIVKDCCDDKSE